jgi:hypothetical protein
MKSLIKIGMVILMGVFIPLSSYASVLYEYTTTDNNFNWSASTGGIIEVTLDCASINGQIESIDLKTYSNGSEVSDWGTASDHGSVNVADGGPTWHTYTLASPEDCTSGSVVIPYHYVSGGDGYSYWYYNGAAGFDGVQTNISCTGSTSCDTNSPVNIRINGVPGGGGGGGGGGDPASTSTVSTSDTIIAYGNVFLMLGVFWTIFYLIVIA